MVNSSPSLSEKTLTALRQLEVSDKALILVAVSGGPDSLALLHVLRSFRDSQKYTLIAAHVNHQLREEAGKDEDLVRSYCTEWNIPLEVKRVDTRSVARSSKKGIEEAARIERYSFFKELVGRYNVQYVLTAHTANDQAETVILNMIRGAGVRGLAGIPPKRKFGEAMLVRPWLNVTREQICEYIEEHGLQPAHDVSNEELTYQRNRIRHRVLPVLREVYPDRSPVRSLSQLAQRMSELSRFLRILTEEKLEMLRRNKGLSLPALKNIRGFLLHDLIEAWIGETGNHYKLTDRETARIGAFFDSKSTSMELRHSLHLRKEGDTLLLESSGNGDYFQPILLAPKKNVSIPAGTITMRLLDSVKIEKDPSKATFDRACIALESLIVRPWQPKDRMVPFGLKGKTKLVSDLLNEAGIHGNKKKKWPVVVDTNDNSIIWVPGVRASNRAVVTAETKDVVILEFEPAD